MKRGRRQAVCGAGPRLLGRPGVPGHTCTGASRAGGRISALVLALALAACSGERNLPDPSVPPANLVYAPAGTRIELLNMVNGEASRERITVAPQTGLRALFTDAQGRAGSAYPGCWGCSAEMTIEENQYAALWPLETGNEVMFLRTGPEGQAARVFIRVSGRDTVKTPAGTFEAWMLDGRVENLTGERHSAQVRAWWAPEPGWVVRAEGGDSRGNTLSSQVVDIDLPRG